MAEKYIIQTWQDNAGGLFLFLLTEDYDLVWGAGDYKEIGRRFLEQDIKNIRALKTIKTVYTEDWQYGTLSSLEEVEHTLDDLIAENAELTAEEYIYIEERG